MMIYPKQTIEGERTITNEFKSMTLIKKLVKTERFDENGNMVMETIYSVDKFSKDGMPCGQRQFGPNKSRAIKYFLSSSF